LKGECTPTSATKVLSGIILEVNRLGELCSVWLRPPRLPTLT
jgi:hypothetical protein